MNTLYDLFNVKEDAKIEEIKESYNKILENAASKPQSEKLTEQIRRIKIAYGILSNPEKRKKYDLDLANKRAEELLGNIQVKDSENQEQNIPKNEEPKNVNQIEEKKVLPNNFDEEKIRKEIDRQIDNELKKPNIHELSQRVNQQREEKQRQQQINEKEQKKQDRKQRRQNKKEQQLKREMEIQAYGEYLQNQGYKVKYPWTWLRIKRTLITLVAVIITFVILWQIPFVRKPLVELYNDNFIIKALVDLVISIFNAIIQGIKGIFVH